MALAAERNVDRSAVKRDYPANVQFGRFRLNSRRRELFADGIAVPIGSRALDILLVLIEARGELVTKDELLSRVWPETIVEENTLQFQISTIRKVLGKDRDFIKTISGRGYRFVCEITDTSSQTDVAFAHGAQKPWLSSLPPTNLWAPTSDFIGRELQLREAADLVEAHRLVTLSGIGGTGKTRLGVELARQLLPKFTDGVWIVELESLSDPDLVLSTVAAVFGFAGGPASPERLAAALAPKRLLLVLDNCEHVIDAAARIAEALLHGTATVQVIATSREPLRVDGECVYPVPPLDVPAEGAEDFDDIMRHGAVTLFIARARAADPRLLPDRRFGTAMSNICRRLDGIPLAIELAASRAAALGVGELSAGLDQCLDLLTSGRRTASARHQSMRATIDWSYDLLTEAERMVLRRLAIFGGSFRLEAATGIAAGAEITRLDVVDRLADLVAKSLVSVDVDGAIVRYRLLETMRAYMLEKLTDSGERNEIARRHAEYYQRLFQCAAIDPQICSAIDWTARVGPDIHNLRSALDWAFSSAGDPSVGVLLATASIPRWLQLQLSHMEVDRSPIESGFTRDAIWLEMEQHATHAGSSGAVQGHVPEARETWANAPEFAAPRILGRDDDCYATAYRSA
jgi:predicted ATPase/DNA-binding winged helix-turn-helix (wHTH) protein